MEIHLKALILSDQIIDPLSSIFIIIITWNETPKTKE